MKIILNGTTSQELLDQFAGGKASNMARITKAGVPTAPWFCIPTPFFFEFIDQFDKGELLKLTQLEIEELFAKKEMNSELSNTIKNEVEKLGLDHKFAVRSSALGEDSQDNSFAGQFSSYLNLKSIEEIITSVKKCWASFFSDRAHAYRIERGIDSSKLGMAVIIQQMIPSEVSGVGFSRDPIHPMKREQMIISAVYGVGEGLVSGELDSDNYYVNRNNLTYKEELTTKDFAFIPLPDGGLKKTPVEESKQKISALRKKDIEIISDMLIKLEAYQGTPQDIEWAKFNDQIICLQTRAITSLPDKSFFDPKIKGGQFILWDNSNITESYSGVTTPLTFSHISKAYRQVYVQFCEVMGVPPELVREHEKTFRNMLGLIRGRVFYNLKNWYHMIFLFPFSSTSNGFMETMMGVKQNLRPELAALFDFTKNPPKYSAFTKLKILFLNIWRIFKVKTIINEFKADFDRAYSVARRNDYSTYSLQELLDEYDKLNEDLLFKWKAPIISDTRCMVFFGVLKSLTEKWIKEGPDNLYNELLTGIKDLPSTQPTKILMGISEKVQKLESEKKFWLENDSATILKELRSGRTPEIAKDFYDYIDQYGFRCINELKLETTDLHEDPTMAIEAIKGFLRNKSITLEEMNRREDLKYKEALGVVEKNLSGLKRGMYLFFLKKAREAVKDREDLRLLRTNIFGICRRIFKSIGLRYFELKLLDEPMDVFYLSIDEIIAYQEGRSFEVNLRELALSRKKQFDHYRKTASPPDRFYTEGAAGLNFLYPQVLSDLDLLVTENSTSSDPNTLLGTPCSPGLVEGVVRVVKEIEDAQGLNGEIMVCERTDPGWVPLFPSTSGLLIERGSLLSHSAIVARELGIPTIVGINGGLMKKLKTGMRVRVDATKGEIKILES